jgi:enterochelin esterase-like enzyme
MIPSATTPTSTPPEMAPKPTISTTPERTETSIPSATPTADCLLAGGTQQSKIIDSEQLGADFHFQIYLPPCYDANPDHRYPVLYLLHGLSYNSEQWLRLGLANTMDNLVAEGTLPPFIIVLPQESPFIPPQASHFPDALIKDLIPWIDENYHTLPEKNYRAIGGLSRGAAWSIRIGFTHPTFFTSVGAHSLPLFEADGGNVSRWLIQTPVEDLPVFFIDIGRDDPEWQTALAFVNLLDEKNIPHEWYLFNDGHTEEYWSDHLETYLQWYARNW